MKELDLEHTYLSVWRRMAAAGALGGVMSAISGLNGVPGAAHTSLLTKLRKEFGFGGFVISDCDFSRLGSEKARAALTAVT